jgi:ubiquitin-protein ligase
LDDAEVSSPANIDAGVMLRKDPEAYKEKVQGANLIPENYDLSTEKKKSLHKHSIY